MRWYYRLTHYYGVRVALSVWRENRRWARDERRRCALWGA